MTFLAEKKYLQKIGQNLMTVCFAISLNQCRSAKKFEDPRPNIEGKVPETNLAILRINIYPIPENRHRVGKIRPIPAEMSAKEGIRLCGCLCRSFLTKSLVVPI